MAIQLTSPAFAEGEPIPTKYTCDGEDVSPPLRWAGAPPETRSFALTCDDPDAPSGTWVHWVLYGLPAATSELPEGVPTTAATLGQAEQGVNDFNRLGYGGPCPPPGHGRHRYFFRLYALDARISLQPGVTRDDLLAAMAGHIVGQGVLMGTYERR